MFLNVLRFIFTYDQKEIKQNIHSLVDTIEDESRLEQLQQVTEHIAFDDVEWETLSDAEKQAIEEGLEDANKGNLSDTMISRRNIFSTTEFFN